MLAALFFLLAFGPKLIGLVIENGLSGLGLIGKELINWYDNPTGFFFTYFAGYIVVWRSKIFGSLIILFACILVTLINLDNPGWFIFTLPAATVGLLYLVLWYTERQTSKV